MWHICQVDPYHMMVCGGVVCVSVRTTFVRKKNTVRLFCENKLCLHCVALNY